MKTDHQPATQRARVSSALLFFPPITGSSKNIHLALPLLAGVLDSLGITPCQHDLNVEFTKWIVTGYRTGCLRKLAFPEQEAFETLVSSLADQDFASLDLTPFHRRLSPLIKEFFKHYFVASADFPKALFIGITIPMATQLVPAVRLAQTLRHVFGKRVPIFLGGPMTSLYLGNVLNDLLLKNAIDGVVKGDGEQATAIIARQLLDGHLRKPEIPNLVYCEENEIVQSAVTARTNLNVLPTPIFDKSQIEMIAPTSLPVLAGRRCYWGKCAYCDYQNLYAAFIPRNVISVVDDIERLMARHGIRKFSLACDTIYPKLAEQLSREILRRRLDIRWSSCVRVDAGYTPEILELMKESGVQHMLVGLESLDDDVLRKIRKGYDSRQAVSFLNLFLSYEVQMIAAMIIDLPGTTYESAKNQLRRLAEIASSSNRKFLSAVCHEFSLTRTSEIGRYPERYGLRVSARPNLRIARATGFRPNVVPWADPHGMTRSEKAHVRSLYRSSFGRSGFTE